MREPLEVQEGAKRKGREQTRGFGSKMAVSGIYAASGDHTDSEGCGSVS